MLRRFLISVLVFSILSVSLSWASEQSASGPHNDHSHSSVQHQDHQVGDLLDEPSTDNDLACDHLCHASAHLIAVTSPLHESDSLAVAQQSRRSAHDHWPTHYFQPLTPPPLFIT